jgi:hypothetical protein
VREYNPDKPTRTDIRAHRRLLDQLLSAGDIVTARKIVDTHPYLRDYEEKIRQCAEELRQERMRDAARSQQPPLPKNESNWQRITMKKKEDGRSF